MLEDSLLPALLTLATVVVMFVLFVREQYPPEVVALSGVALMLATGVLGIERIDTRMLTRVLRSGGVLAGAMTDD
ncbi:MAG: hypothetical protein AAFU49_12520, partial [Pseudomonadota bacterium]